MEKRLYPAIGETLYCEKLPNGLQILVLPKPGFKKAQAYFATDYGGNDRRFMLGGRWIDTPAGVAHFLEHKMFEMPDGVNALTAMSSNGADPNAWTGPSRTAYFFSCTDKFYENLRSLLTFVSTPYFTEDSVAKEQGIIAQEIRMGDDSPDQRLYYDLLQSLYENHPIRDAVAGTVESIAEITPETLYYCHKVFYNPSNMVLSVVGDVDPVRVANIAEELLPKEPGEIPVRDLGEEPSGFAPLRSRFRRGMEVSIPRFAAGVKLAAPKKGEDAMYTDLVSTLALKCLAGRSSPLYTGLYAQGLLDKQFSCGANNYSGAFFAVFMGASRDPEAVLDAIQSRIQAVAKNGFDEDYFRRTARACYGGQIWGLENFLMLSDNLSGSWMDGYCALDSFEAAKTVTAAQCADFIAKNLTPDRFTMAVVDSVRK